MYSITIVISIILSLFSTIVMSYVSLATPIGPWIAPTLVFIALLFSKICTSLQTKNIAYAVSAGSIGGILATACGFSFPTFYFLDPSSFSVWMEYPLFFSCMLGGLSLFGGLFGFYIADFFEHSFIEEQKLAFPIGSLVQKMIATKNQVRKAYELMIGFGITAGLYCMQAGIFFKGLLPHSYTVLSARSFAYFTLPKLVIHLDTVPMVVAIGFVTGHVIALPLAIGSIAMILFVTPLHVSYFFYLSQTEFVLAFCSGVVVYITGTSLLALPEQLIHGMQKVIMYCSLRTRVSISTEHIVRGLCGIGLFGTLSIFLSYAEFPLIVQWYLMICSVITTYQIVSIAGRIGLALLGRFATFVMIPAWFIFDLTYMQIVFIATFVEIAGGVATDVLFGRKVAQLSNISKTTMRFYQLLGLVVSAASIGIIFWCFINHFGLGSPELCAYRAQSRQLLLNAQQFDYYVMLIGALFGYVLKLYQVNPMLVLGGLLMPFDMTLCLVIGGLLAYCSKEKEELFPFWSGVFASNSLCMLLRSMMKFFV